MGTKNLKSRDSTSVDAKELKGIHGNSWELEKTHWNPLEPKELKGIHENLWEPKELKGTQGNTRELMGTRDPWAKAWLVPGLAHY